MLRIEPKDISKNLVMIKQTKPKPMIRYVNISDELEKTLKEKLYLVNKFSKGWTTKKFGKILKKLNLKGSIHSLRHSFTTNHYYLNTPAKQIQVWLGHSSIKITMDIYTNLDPRINPKQEKLEIKKLYNNLYYYIE